MHTLYTQDLIEISEESNENIDILSDLLRGELEAGKNLRASHPFALMCELIWLNSVILFTLRKDLADITFKDEEQREVIVPKKTIETLTSLLIARLQASNELNSLSYSISLH